MGRTYHTWNVSQNLLFGRQLHIFWFAKVTVLMTIVFLSIAIATNLGTFSSYHTRAFMTCKNEMQQKALLWSGSCFYQFQCTIVLGEVASSPNLSTIEGDVVHYDVDKKPSHPTCQSSQLWRQQVMHWDPMMSIAICLLPIPWINHLQRNAWNSMTKVYEGTKSYMSDLRNLKNRTMSLLS